MRLLYTIILFAVMAATGGHDTGDRLTCGVGITLFCIAFSQEQKGKAVIFGLLIGIWALTMQPGILNRCHLTLWILIFEAVRNLFVVESHATIAWGHASAGRVFGLF